MNKLIYVALTLLIIGACKQDPLSKEIALWESKVFDIPSEMELAVDSSGTLQDSDVLKIITVIQGHCGSCVLDLQDWEALMSEEEFSTENIRYYFLIESDDDFMNFQYLQEQEQLIDYPLIVDLEKKYFKSIGLSEDYRFQTFLLNHKNEVLSIGHPLGSEKIKEHYKKKIRSNKTS